MTRDEARETRASAVPESPNALDDESRKAGRWTESDPHGGMMVGDYVEGKRHGTLAALLPGRSTPLRRAL